MQRARRHPDLDNMPDFLFENTLIQSDPREENCNTTIKDYCCPNFKLMSFTAIISLIQLLLFIFMCFFGDFKFRKQFQFSNDTLKTFGRCSAYNVKYKIEFYRLIACLFIFNNVKDLCGELLLQVIIVSMIEKFVNIKTTFYLYLLTGIVDQINFIKFILNFINSWFNFLDLQFRMHNRMRQDKQSCKQLFLFQQLEQLGFLQKFINLQNLWQFLNRNYNWFDLTNKNRIFQRSKLKFVGLGVIFIYFTGFIYIFFWFRMPLHPIEQQ
ncbi:unnamed protein product [Paramecium sonneborni]|uniref:rhomboid protease n=1 Tax=Paramecium sonneborni TaxID=65129 RepID=A0A8S1L010_9CILI|nr:unnamed protein product [Paramecium sonneborni]